MNDYIWQRVIDIANHVLSTGDTVRAVAETFGVSKSTVHKDLTERLYQINPGLAKQVKAVLETNKAERHLRGGEATRRKYRGTEEKVG
ncbi:MAG: sporulation transcriptional regulator SpoIIID [Eubacteriales bacterium]|jgi:putative DeoR family transcriptional regulator (stage III sporulation protein D)|nr:sporulation transcriptional regulator SpoIIID [Eubacteriales bacterium]MDD3072922.1 sporulation transcriptional regulator SpoIIID [Eubacteriales bacterium]MDD4078143.1 sporulation transcriptional regulator SpoIIID [Eubacteriales bacterium]MDD4768430.1 sporulation transcriptional regulator SpoIIID [Eubacteriales bacterium]HCX77948.1 sporulation transcriptional regulator SpoIIID [Bacillota bacterium]